MAALKDQVAAGLTQLSPDGRAPGQQLLEIGDRVEDLIRQQEDLYLGELVPAIKANGIVMCRWSELDLDDRKHLDEVFDERVFPVLTPLGVDPAHPFPYISNLSLNLAVSVYDDLNSAERFARVKVPPTLAAVHRPARRRALHPPRRPDRGPPRLAVPGHDGGRPLDVPGHPQRRPHRRGGGGRRPPRRPRDGAAAPPLRPRRAPGDRGRRVGPRARARSSPSSTSPRTTSRSTTRRSTSPGCGRCTGSIGRS